MAKIKPVVLLGLPEKVEDCGSQRRAALSEIRARTFKRAFASQAKREAHLVGRVNACRREAVIRPLAA